MRPATFPERLQHGDYVAIFEGISERFPGDTLVSASWEIRQGDRVVGRMFNSDAYSWRPHTSLSKLVWSGPWPTDQSDSRSANYGMCFDGSPCESYEAAMKDFAARADRLIAWRERQ